jgi:beta-lactam-binding protein with PASTA domain
VDNTVRKKWLWIGAAALVVLLGGAVAIFMRQDKVAKVPQLETKLLAEVKEDLDKLGIAHEVVARVVTPDGSKPAGYIFEQNPKVGTVVPPGGKVQLKIETASVLVPALTGDKLAAAMAKTDSRNLDLKPPHARVDGNNIDKIVDQNPKPNTRVAEGTPVEIWIGTPTPAVNPALLKIFNQQISQTARTEAIRTRELTKPKKK